MYGERVIPKYNLADSDFIVSFGADFLETWLSPMEYTSSFGELHTFKNGTIGKFVYLGAAETLTATNSDEFILIDSGTETQIILALAEKLRNKGADISQTPSSTPRFSAELDKKLDDLADQIKAAKSPIILAGRPEDKSREGINTVKAANLLNRQLSAENLIDFSQKHALGNAALSAEIHDFLESITGNTLLIVHETNPIYSIPEARNYFSKAAKIIYIGSTPNETSAMANWILPANYYLENWGDFEAWSGSVSLLQPTMAPLFDTKNAGEIFYAITKNISEKTFDETVRENWVNWAQISLPDENQSPETNTVAPDNSLDLQQKRLLQNGFLTKATASTQLPAIDSNFTVLPHDRNAGDFMLKVSPSHYFYDGSLANRGWLQEIPHPVSNIVWQSWVDINSEKAKELDIEEGDVLTLESSNGSIEVPARLSTKISKNTLLLDAGQGHTQMGETANGVGVNAFSLMPATGSDGQIFVSVKNSGNTASLNYLNATKNQHDRELLKHVKLQELQAGTAETEEMNWPMKRGYEKDKDLYQGHEYEKYRWGMAIDLQKCVGCKACEAACYAENNIPVVGMKNAMEGREMSWLKVVPYEIDEKQTAFLPTPCQQCDSAPCEPVCPVYASVHSEEGLNAQIYNRCIGTRYCSNNCPYKVRRFNWGNQEHKYPLTLQLNPEVTVRERGVMEKCTFCVQRIRNHEYQAKIENRELKDGEIVPACAQTCPTKAIVFGDLLDENSEVRKLIADGRKYQLLNELNTKTAVVYLKKITV